METKGCRPGSPPRLKAGLAITPAVLENSSILAGGGIEPPDIAGVARVGRGENHCDTIRTAAMSAGVGIWLSRY